MGCWREFSARTRSAPAAPGFTLVELVTVIVIMGVLVAIARPQFFTSSPFQSAGFAGEVAAGLRHAQALAMASGCDTQATLNASAFTVQRWTGGSSCTDHNGTLSTVTRPGGGSYSSSVPTGLAVTGGTVFFDSLGRPYNGTTGALLSGTLVFTIGSRQVSIQAETGLVR